MSDHHAGNEHTTQPFVARTIHRFSVPIILAWLAVAVIVSIGVPSLEQVEKEHSVSLSPDNAPSFQAAQRMGQDFGESTSDSAVMIVLEGQQPLGDDAHKYYDRLIRQLQDDPKHVVHIQNFWGDPLLAGAAQSADSKAAYVQVSLAGRPASTLANKSTEAVRDIVGRTPAPPGVKTYVTGPAAIVADMGRSGDKTVILIQSVSLAVIFITLLLVYRSIITVILLLLMVGLELQVARGIVAFLGDHQIVGLTTYAINLLVAIGIAAGTDYGIFFTGVSRGTSVRRGSGNGLLHHLPRGRQGCLGLRCDDRRSGFLPELYPAAFFPTPGRPLRGGHTRRGRGRAHAGSCSS